MSIWVRDIHVKLMKLICDSPSNFHYYQLSIDIFLYIWFLKFNVSYFLSRLIFSLRSRLNLSAYFSISELTSLYAMYS